MDVSCLGQGRRVIGAQCQRLQGSVLTSTNAVKGLRQKEARSKEDTYKYVPAPPFLGDLGFRFRDFGPILSLRHTTWTRFWARSPLFLRLRPISERAGVFAQPR